MPSRLPFLVLVLMTAERPVWAHDHVPPQHQGAVRSLGQAVSLEPEIARFRIDGGAGNYQGLGVRAAAWFNGFSVAAHLATYRLDGDDSTFLGLGDLDMEVSARLFATPEPLLSAGVTVGASLPSGEAEKFLGMGHPMLLAQGWATGTWGRLTTTGHLGYARKLDAAGHHVHLHGAPHSLPLVNPMNDSEVTGGLVGRFRLLEPLHIIASGVGAWANTRIRIEACGPGGRRRN